MAIIKESSKLRTAIHQRLKELYPSNRGHGFVNSAVVKDAEERGIKITPETLSRYISGNKDKGSLSEAQIIWLAYRYYIPVQLNIGIAKMVDGKVQFEIPKYNELEALRMLKLIFG